jgi:voltage-gated sodium channel
MTRAAVPQGPVVHTDDTGWRVRGEPAVLMAFETDTAIGSHVWPRPRHEEVQEVIPVDYEGVMGTDRGRRDDAQAFDDAGNDRGSGSPPTAGTRSHTMGVGDGRSYRGIHGQGRVNSSHTDLAPSLRERLRVFIESMRFERAMTTLIVANAITLGLETSPPVVARVGDWLHVIDRTALGVFAVELLLRFFVYRSRFFHDPWRVFDFGIVGIALMPASGAFSVLRALRVLRVLRLVSLVPSMRGVVGALLTALPGMASIIGLVALVLYVSAVLATKLFGEIAPEFFGSLSASLFTLFQVMTVEGWPDIARGVMAQSPYAWIFFVVYLLIATFMVLNLFIAVVVNAMQSQVTEDLKGEGEAHTRLILDEVRALRREIEALRGPSKS